MEFIMSLLQQDNEYLFGIVVFDYGDISKIHTTIESLKQINYNKKKYKIVLSSKHNSIASTLFNYIDVLTKNDNLSELIITIDKNADIETEAYRKCIGANYLIKINAGDAIEPDFLTDLNKLFNENIDCIAVEKDNIKIIQFKTANEQYLDYNNFDALFNKLKEDTDVYKKLNEK